MEPGELIECVSYEIHLGALLDEALPEKQGAVRAGEPGPEVAPGVVPARGGHEGTPARDRFRWISR